MSESVQKREQRGIMNKMRQHTHIVLYVLVGCFVGLIIFEWGADVVGSRSATQTNSIGEVNGQEITYDIFWRNVQSRYVMIRDQFGTAPDEQTMRLVRDQIFNDMVNSLLIQNAIEESGLIATDEDVLLEVMNRPRPEFLSSPDFLTDSGIFDNEKYDVYLRQLAQNNSESILFLESDARSHIPEYKLRNMINATVRVTDAELRQQFAEEELTATVDFIRIDNDRFADTEIDIPDSEIADYYRSHTDDFFQEETRQLRYVHFELNPTNADSAGIDDNIEEALERAHSGEDFSDLAIEYTDTDGDLGIFGKGAMAPEFESAVFNESVKTGDIIGPVETTFGKHIIKIDRLVKRRGSIDSVAARHILFSYVASNSTVESIETDARYFVLSARDEGFEATANKNVIPINSIFPFPDNGFIPGFGLNSEISNFAFTSIYNSENPPISDVTETPAGFFVFQLFMVNEALTQTLNNVEVRLTIEQILREQKQRSMAQNLLAQIKTDIDSGTQFAEAAEKADLEVQTTLPFKMTDFIPGVGNDITFTSAVFGMNFGEVSRPVSGTNGVYLINLKAKDEFDEERFAQQKSTIADRLMVEKANATFNAWIQNLRDKSEIIDNRSQYFTR